MIYFHPMATEFDIGQLRMFFTLARTGSYTGAAERLHRTQSAVSHAIRKLEASAGVPLVDRRGRGFRLTEDGRRLFQACEAAFSALEGAAEDIARRHGRGLGRLRLGATVEFGCSILMKHMGPFLRDHPDIAFEFRMSHELLRPLLRDELDVIIDCKEHRHPSLERRPLFRETYTVVCSPAYRKRLGLATVSDLERAAVLSLDEEALWWQRFVLSLPSMSRPELPGILPVNHIRGMVVAAIHGIGVALVPTYTVLAPLERGQLIELFPEMDVPEDRFSLYQKKQRKGLGRHRLLTAYLRSIRPSEFGSQPGKKKKGKGGGRR